ncbi:unnamed protein product [Cyclocybe aegerita]|uniref:Ubiquitin-like domain-containing protein n=1 Tax=Cyclocybe aegerita TaxID=1973307 RepID=A0A8S0WB26_CYCAE|nr:unnamed protein product [Cyclocybe aegerita]
MDIYALFKDDFASKASPKTYAAAVAAVRTRFLTLAIGYSISFETDELDICDGQSAEIPEDVWEVLSEVKSVRVKATRLQKVAQLPSPEPANTQEKLSFFVDYRNTLVKCSAVTPSTSIRYILESALTALGHSCAENWKLIFDARVLDLDQTIADTLLQDGDHLDLLAGQKGGKPVIYLFSPQTLEASVKLSLVPQWDLSVIYPVVSIKPRTVNTNEEVAWRVRVHPKGEITELTTGLGVAYLFWEALTNPIVSPPSSPVESQVEILEPNNAVLNALNLHYQRSRYWLPSILKHKHIALRFLPQSAYERINDDALDHWSVAKAKAIEDVNLWRNIVGVDLDRAKDTSLFRVLEWRGMEVLH